MFKKIIRHGTLYDIQKRKRHQSKCLIQNDLQKSKGRCPTFTSLERGAIYIYIDTKKTYKKKKRHK